MSSGIWTRCGGVSEIRPLRQSPWRVVEAQHQVSTRKLVDTLEEQALLEELIDGAKPPDPTRGRLHYLLATPFRYPPLRHGSRFRAPTEPGVWYGSQALRTAFAESAYYRLLFLEGTHARLDALSVQLTAFTVRVRTDHGVDLAAPPFAAFRDVIASPVDYAESQALGRDMREAGVEVFRFPSARDREDGINVGVLKARAFGVAKPRELQTWHCTATRRRVEFVRLVERAAYVFPREEFLVDGGLPAPAA